MLCPEVLNFKEPASVFQSQKVEKDTCLKTVTDFNFVHLVTVILPDTLKVPDTFGQDLTSCDYYKINSLNIGELVTEKFLNSFIHCGSINLLSINTRIDCDNCIAIIPSGQLILNLDKVTFQTLGLEGKVSHFHTLTKEKYVVNIDLKSNSFKPGKPNYERTKSCLQKLKNFEVIVTWEPPEKEICPSSIAKYFSDLGYGVKLCKILKDTDTKYSVKVPIIEDFEKFDEEECANFIEWLGMISINGTLDEKLDFISTYTTPEPCVHLGQVKIVRWRGFFSSRMVANLILQLEKFRSSSEFWKALYFQGFSDSPVVWGSNEHHYYTNGDNAGVVILDKKKHYICLQKCSNKRYK